MQCACAILSSVACPAVPYFSTSSYKRHHFRKKSMYEKCVLRFDLQLLPENFFILGRSERDMIKKNVHWFSSVVKQMPGYNSPRRGTALTVPITFLCCSIYCFCVVLCIVFVLSYVLFFCRSVYCLCVNVYCTTAS
jgi:hypothetical protein